MKSNWTKEETIIAFNVYCKIPFKSSSKTHPTIIKYAKILGRSPSALNMKIGNFGRLDPELRKKGIVGLSHGSKLEEEVWNEFHGNWEELAYESELLIAKKLNKNINEYVETQKSRDPLKTERTSTIKTRVNQNFFRSVILSSYNLKCCITGIPVPEFLNASHIIPWSENKEERLNPRNGLCLNALHDRAFDKGFITVSEDYTILVSNELSNSNDENMSKYFFEFHQKKIILPDRFLPDQKFLEFHKNNIFRK